MLKMIAQSQQKLGVADVFGGTMKLIAWDWSTLLLFELMYQFLLLSLFPMVNGMLDYAMGQANLTVLTNSNVDQLWTNPFSVAALLGLLFLMALFSYVQIAAVMIYFRCGREGRTLGALRLFWEAVKKTGALFHSKKFLLLPFLLLLLPLTGLVFFSGVLREFAVVDFITELVAARPILSIVYVVALLFLYFLFFPGLFTLHEMILCDCSFQKANRISRQLVLGKMGAGLFPMCLWFFAAAVMAGVLYLCAVSVLALSSMMFYGEEQGFSAFWFAYSKLWQMGNLLLSVYSLICILSVLTFLYFKFTEERCVFLRSHNVISMYKGKEEIAFLRGQLEKTQESKQGRDGMHTAKNHWGEGNQGEGKRNRLKRGSDGSGYGTRSERDYARDAARDADDYARYHRRKGAWHVDRRFLPVVRMLLVFVVCVLSVESAVIGNPGVKDRSKPQIVAYTAASGTVPVDKREALQEARRSGAAFVEIEVGKEMPEVEELLKLARGRLGLILKLSSDASSLDHQIAVEENLTQIIEKYDMEGQCLVASMDYASLERIKAVAPRLRTAYMVAAPYGDLQQMKAADMLIMEETLVTAELVGEIHGHGKPLLARTAHGEEAMERLLRLGVDGIVTKDPDLAGYVVETGAL